MVQLGTLALDGTKFQGNASRHKAMSYGYMKKEVGRLRAEIQELLQQAREVDAQDDAGWARRGGRTARGIASAGGPPDDD